MNKVAKGIIITIIVIVLIILAPIVLIFTTVEGATYYNKAKDYIAGKTYAKPVVNPNPKKFLTIKGHIESGLRVRLSVGYITQNPKCDATTNWLEGVSGSRGHLLFYYLKPNAQGNYQIPLPIDGLEPGVCRWRSELIQYHVYTNRKQWQSQEHYAVALYRSGSQKGTLPFVMTAKCWAFGDHKREYACDNFHESHANSIVIGKVQQLTINFMQKGTHK